MTISALCTVKDGAGSPVATAGGVNVTPANTITIALASTSGVDEWDLTILGMDDVTAAPTVTVNPTTKTATFTAPAAGAAIGFSSKATSRNGRDPSTGRSPYSVTETFGVYTLVSGNRTGFAGETFEGSAAFGWSKKVNTLIRTGGGGGITPTGTGFRHVTAGTEDGAAALVVNADVNAAAGIVGSKLASVLAIGTAVSTGVTVAATGMFRGANTVAPVLTARNGGNTADLSLVAHGASDALTFGDATNAGVTVFTSGAGDCTLSTGNGVIVYLAYASGNVFVSGTSLITFSTNFVGGSGVDIVPIYNGAAIIRFGNLVTSAKLHIVDTTTNSATGAKLSVLGQNATGTTTTGGELEVGPGTGTTANGKLSLVNIITGSTVGAAGGASALPATPTGYLNIKVNGGAQRIPYYA